MASMAAETVVAVTSMISCSLVSRRSVRGMRTLTDISGRDAGFFLCEQRFELAQAGFDLARFSDMAGNGIEGLESIAGNAKHGGFARGNFPGGNEFLRHAHGHTDGGLGENAFALGEQADAFADFVVGHVVGMSAGFL